MNTQIRTALAAATLIAALTTGATAAEIPQVHVKYQDLNLTTPAGAKVLYHRIRSAADQVCAIPGTRDLTMTSAAKVCADRAIADAVAHVNNPQLTNVYMVQIGEVTQTRLAAR